MRVAVVAFLVGVVLSAGLLAQQSPDRGAASAAAADAGAPPEPDAAPPPAPPVPVPPPTPLARRPSAPAFSLAVTQLQLGT